MSWTMSKYGPRHAADPWTDPPPDPKPGDLECPKCHHPWESHDINPDDSPPTVKCRECDCHDTLPPPGPRPE